MIWESCQGEDHIQALNCEPWRVVEDQFHLSSRDLVDSHAEHDVLESMIENSKPTVDSPLHYLIFTPFRYPPLKHGSRFGSRFEPSLWYGSLKLKTAFAEVAYYRFQFFRDTVSDLGYINMNMTAFTAILETQHFLDLTQAPFDQYRDSISHQSSYELSQSLGANMRSKQIEAFQYYSARTPEPEMNIAAFTPSVFRKINHHQNWICTSHKTSIEFSRSGIEGVEYFGFSL